MNPLVSIIIPTYNGSNMICRSVESALSQSYTNIEVIVVDDNGKGTKEQILTETAINKFKKDTRFHYIAHETNMNGSVARNTGFKHSTGEFITLLDDDDEYLCNRIADSITLFSTLDESYGLVWCSTEIFVDEKFAWRRIVHGKGDIFKHVLMHDDYSVISSNTLMVKRHVYEELQGFDESFRRHQDYEFTARVANKYNIHCIKKVGNRHHMTRRNSPKSFETIINYRHHFLSKMMPMMMERYNRKQIDFICSINILQACYADSESEDKLLLYKKACEICKDCISNYSLARYYRSIIHIKMNNIITKFIEKLYKL